MKSDPRPNSTETPQGTHCMFLHRVHGCFSMCLHMSLACLHLALGLSSFWGWYKLLSDWVQRAKRSQFPSISCHYWILVAIDTATETLDFPQRCFSNLLWWLNCSHLVHRINNRATVNYGAMTPSMGPGDIIDHKNQDQVIRTPEMEL